MDKRVIEVNGLIAKYKEQGMRTKDISDGFHTFFELYDHRAKLFSMVCRAFSDKAWKALKHEDGTMFDGMFIVGVETPQGQYTYHYNMEYWDMFPVAELDFAPEYDGHKPKDIDRLFSLFEEPMTEGIRERKVIKA